MPEIPTIAYMALSIPILSIVLGIGTAWYKQWLNFKRETMMMNQSSQPQLNASQNQAIEELRQELMAFKDTVTQYDMTVDRSLNEIKQRLDFIESERVVARPQIDNIPAITQSEIELQKIGLNK